MYNVYKNNLNLNHINVFADRESEIIDILGTNVDYADITGFASCEHDLVLENDFGKTFKELLAEITEINK